MRQDAAMSIEALCHELAGLAHTERNKIMAFLVALQDRADAGVSGATSAQRPTSVDAGFDPARFGFVLLHDFRPPGDFRVYEYGNHRCVDGRYDFHRLNFYLSQDGAFVTVWSGLLEDAMVEAMFCEHGVPPVDYTENLFRGHIEDDEQARHILKSLQLDEGSPQILRTDPTHGIVCEILD